MTIENNGPESPYPGPAEPGSDKQVYPDRNTDTEGDISDDTSRNDVADDPDMPVTPPVDEAEEPSPGSAS